LGREELFVHPLYGGAVLLNECPQRRTSLLNGQGSLGELLELVGDRCLVFKQLLLQSEQMVDVFSLLLVGMEVVLRQEGVVVVQSLEDECEVSGKAGLNNLHDVDQLHLLGYNNFRHNRIIYEWNIP
jgi:hypothetical protein